MTLSKLCGIILSSKLRLYLLHQMSHLWQFRRRTSLLLKQQIIFISMMIFFRPILKFLVSYNYAVIFVIFGLRMLILLQLQLMPGCMCLEHVRVREIEKLLEKPLLTSILIYYFLIIPDFIMFIQFTKKTRLTHLIRPYYSRQYQRGRNDQILQIGSEFSHWLAIFWSGALEM